METHWNGNMEAGTHFFCSLRRHVCRTVDAQEIFLETIQTSQPVFTTWPGSTQSQRRQTFVLAPWIKNRLDRHRGRLSGGTNLLTAVRTNKIRKRSGDTALPRSLLKTLFLVLVEYVSLVIEAIAKTKHRISDP